MSECNLETFKTEIEEYIISTIHDDNLWTFVDRTDLYHEILNFISVEKNIYISISRYIGSSKYVGLDEDNWKISIYIADNILRMSSAKLFTCIQKERIKRIKILKENEDNLLCKKMREDLIKVVKPEPPVSRSLKEHEENNSENIFSFLNRLWLNRDKY